MTKDFEKELNYLFKKGTISADTLANAKEALKEPEKNQHLINVLEKVKGAD